MICTSMSNCHRRRARGRKRGGFTLVELLVVVVILAILIGLLVPVIAGALRTAKNAACQSEINLMAQALANFKAAYGDYPPSRVYLSENGVFPAGTGTHVNGDANDITLGQLAQRSLISLRRFFPKVVFSSTLNNPPPQINYNPGTGAGFWYDFNGNGKMDGPYILQGDECLVFFLGGIPLQDPNTGAFGMTGFGKDPINPFTNSIIGSGMYSANRQPPSFEFNAGRLFLDPSNPSVALNGLAAPGIPAYYDNLGGTAPPLPGLGVVPPTTMNFYVYFSGYGNGVYDANDVNFLFSVGGSTVGFEFDGNGTTPIGLKYQHAGSIYPSASPNPYTLTSTITTSGTVTFEKAQTFQIFSAGADGNYGVGGQFIAPSASSSTASNPLPFDANNTLAGTAVTGDATIRIRERDNLTNFQSGTLQ
jgi:prepilin-type N-terminal cleavage/methylation domain-containing protein